MKILVGDILQSKAQTLINTVNCVGIMGKGIAMEFKKRFPLMFEDYVARCDRREVKPGIPYLYKTLFPPQIVNFPTKDHWKSVSKISDIEHGLQYLLSHYREWGITSLAIPPLGCGNGRLEWKEVGPLIYQYSKQMDIPVEMYAPYGTSAKELTIEFLSQVPFNRNQHSNKVVNSTLNPAWVALVEIFHRIEEQPYHWPVGRTIFQKIAYVATQQGLPTGFVYQKGSFGPFCKELKNAETMLINNNLVQEERLGRMFVIKVGPNYQRVKPNFNALFSQWTKIIEKTTDLFMRMNTKQAEVVATIMYATAILKANECPTEAQILESVMQWKQKRRPPLEKSFIASTIRNLGMLHWLEVQPDRSLTTLEDDFITE